MRFLALKMVNEGKGELNTEEKAILLKFDGSNLQQIRLQYEVQGLRKW